MNESLGRWISIKSGKIVGKDDILYKCTHCGGDLDLKSYNAMSDTCNKCRYKNNYNEVDEFIDSESGVNNVDMILSRDNKHNNNIK